MKYMKQLCLGFGENTACNYNPWEKDNSWAESPFTLVFCPGTSQIAAQGRRTHKEDSSLTGQGKHWSCLGPTSLLCSVAQEAEMRELHREGASEICIVVPSGIWLNTNPCSVRLDSTGHRSSTERLLEQWKQNRDPRSGQVLEEVPFPNCWSEEAQKGHTLRTGTVPESSGPSGLVPRTAASASRVNLLEVPVFWPQPGQGIWNPRGGIQHFVDQVKVYKEIEKYF